MKEMHPFPRIQFKMPDLSCHLPPSLACSPNEVFLMLEVQQRSGRKRGAISPPRSKGLQYVESREGLHDVEISFLPAVWHQI